tara:strand:+ start:457 stop:696 length:240 start_codon:yes stop_codon:yes gene_type:complete
MGFHKRYIDDELIIDLFRSRSTQAVIDLYSKGVDALIISGDLADKVGSLIEQADINNVKDYNRISTTLARASYKKRMNN